MPGALATSWPDKPSGISRTVTMSIPDTDSTTTLTPIPLVVSLKGPGRLAVWCERPSTKPVVSGDDVPVVKIDAVRLLAQDHN